MRPNVWRYRDWVIGALNDDMPYDRFLRLQLAGDEVEPDNPDALIATAFCLSGPDMPDINSQDERRHNLLNEMTATVGSVLFGLQMGCAQCHDHKYDPISQADFYRMRAIFEPAVQLKKNESVFTLVNAAKAEPSFVMLRGDHRRPGPRIEPAFPRIADYDRAKWNASSPGQASGRRTALANWLTAPAHPLTARVMVNRIWQQHFGQGLSTSSSDFGVMGAEPTHPELLDWLAAEFVQHGWSLKSQHRLMVTSATYRRASRSTEPGWDEKTRRTATSRWRKALAADPTNALLARFPRRRLAGEAVRDTLHSVSGMLNRQAGGPGTMPPLPPEMLRTLLKNQWKTTQQQSQHYRRSIYVFARRNLRYPIFEAFDRPDANASCDCRTESTTANQSLLMLNSTESHSAARRLAEHSLAQAGTTLDAAALAFFRCFGRPIQNDEHELIQEFLTPAANQPTTAQATEDLIGVCLGFINANEFIYID